MDFENDVLRKSSIEFAVYVSDICEGIKGCSVFVNQLVRCSSSIGANLFEGKYAQSRADFINKFEIALKETYESEYWIELLFRKNKLNADIYSQLLERCGTIRRLIIASVTTAKKNAET